MRVAYASLVALLSACTSVASPSPSSLSHDITLTDAGCTSTPRDGVPPGTLRLTIENGSSGLANFELRSLDSTFAEFDAFLVDARESVDAGEPPPDELPDSSEITRLLLESGETGVLAAELTASVYAVVCVVLDEHDDVVTVYGVGPYTVTD